MMETIFRESLSNPKFPFTFNCVYYYHFKKRWLIQNFPYLQLCLLLSFQKGDKSSFYSVNFIYDNLTNFAL